MEEDGYHFVLGGGSGRDVDGANIREGVYVLRRLAKAASFEGRGAVLLC